MSKVAIIGGGVAGSTIALHLAQLGVEVELFEQKQSLISGPPFCHLHAGGNLYREIDDNQCLSLLEQSIDFIKLYPLSIDYRPTVVSVPIDDEGSADSLLPRLEKLQKHYQYLIHKDKSNMLLGDPSEYYRLYSHDDLIHLKEADTPSKAQCAKDWMISVAKYVDTNKLQSPLVMVQEYGINMFWVASLAQLALQSMPSAKLHLNTKVTDINNVDDTWYLTASSGDEIKTNEFDYLINAAGFETGNIDDMLDIKVDRMVEFKAAYVTKWDNAPALFPEIIFHGKRGTPKGMGQFTPYMSNHFQLHGMTKDITLFEDGLQSSTQESSYPRLPKHLLQKIKNSWDMDEVQSRTQKAIKHIARYIPTFQSATTASVPLFGAQQIPGNNPELRVAEVAFDMPRYARCEIVKVSSVTKMSDAIIEDMKRFHLLSPNQKAFSTIDAFATIDIDSVASLAQQIAKGRGYPSDMAKIVYPN
jgi:hypothetical protein